MKKNNLLLLSIPILILTSCNSTENTSGDSLKNNNFTSEMLNLLASGFSADSVVSMGGEESYGGFYNQCVEVHCVDDIFEYKAWAQSSINEEANKNSLQYDIRYEPLNQNGTKILAETELGFNNRINKFAVQDSYGSVIKWSNAGYSNVFSLFNTKDFVKTENENEFSLEITNNSYSIAYGTLATKFSGMIGLTTDRFIIKTDGEKPISYTLVCEKLDSKYGDIETTINGKFIDFGSNVVKTLKVLDIEEDIEFVNAFSTLKESNNWELDVELTGKSYHIENYNNKAVVYDLYDKNKIQTGCYGYVQLNDETVQGVTQIGDTLYYDSDELSGDVDSILPSLEISSVFFTKDESSTSNKLIYNLKDDYKDVPSSNDYGMFAGNVIGSLQIIFEDSKITFINKLSSAIEKFTYSNINGVKDLTKGIQENCDNLTWSELASNQSSELEKLYASVPQEALDQIPTIGGKYSYITLDVSYNPKKPVFTVPISDTSTGESIYEIYKDKFISSGFSKTDESKTSTGKKYVYQKECLIGDKTKKINVEICIVYDIYSFSSRFLVYPSII